VAEHGSDEILEALAEETHRFIRFMRLPEEVNLLLGDQREVWIIERRLGEWLTS